jgi:hypothetical protein
MQQQQHQQLYQQRSLQHQQLLQPQALCDEKAALQPQPQPQPQPQQRNIVKNKSNGGGISAVEVVLTLGFLTMGLLVIRASSGQSVYSSYTGYNGNNGGGAWARHPTTFFGALTIASSLMAFVSLILKQELAQTQHAISAAAWRRRAAQQLFIACLCAAVLQFHYAAYFSVLSHGLSVFANAALAVYFAASLALSTAFGAFTFLQQKRRQQQQQQQPSVVAAVAAASQQLQQQQLHQQQYSHHKTGAIAAGALHAIAAFPLVLVIYALS